MGVDHPGQDAGLFEKGVGTFPVDAGTFHHHELYAKRHQPIHHRPLIASEAAELALFLGDAPIVVFDQDGDGMEHPVHIDARSHLLKSMKRFHEKLPSLH
jgi:hypothetical protein